MWHSRCCPAPSVRLLASWTNRCLSRGDSERDNRSFAEGFVPSAAALCPLVEPGGSSLISPRFHCSAAVSGSRRGYDRASSANHVLESRHPPRALRRDRPHRGRSARRTTTTRTTTTATAAATTARRHRPSPLPLRAGVGGAERQTSLPEGGGVDRVGVEWPRSLRQTMALTAGTRLGHYDVTALIGEGGMGRRVAVRPIR